MAAYGFDGSVNEAEWAQMLMAASDADHKVLSGLNPTPGSGTRQVNVSAGRAFVAGVYVDIAATSVTFPERAGSSLRQDMVVLEVDWTANTATVKAKVGTSPVAPTLTQTVGTLWEMPIASVITDVGATSYTSAKVISRRPLTRRVRRYRVPGINAGSWSPPLAGKIVSDALEIPDPGYPYYLQAQAQVSLSAANGRVILGVENWGAYFAEGLSDTFIVGEERVMQVTAHDTSGVYEREALVRVRLTTSAVTAGSVSLVSPNYAHCTILQIPA